jgi:hypothetical protein
MKGRIRPEGKPIPAQAGQSDASAKRLAVRAASLVRRRLAELREADGSKNGGRRVPMIQHTEWYGKKRGKQGRRRAVIIGTTPGRNGICGNPGTIIAYRILDALRPRDPFRTPGLVKQIDPTTGAVRFLDPVTREEVRHA